jgi:ABC-type Zn uptake system ZnuABC Zn-binding protein ZnuA
MSLLIDTQGGNVVIILIEKRFSIMWRPTCEPTTSMKYIFVLALWLISLTCLAQEPLNVVVTTSIIADLVKNLGGDLIDITVLVGPDSDPHDYEPTPQDSVALAQAQLIIENGLGFESWLEDLLTASGSSAKRVTASEGIVALTGEGNNDEHELNPHIWHDPINAMRMIDNIASGLVAADPLNQAIYRENAASYKVQLEQLDAYIKTQVETIPLEKRKLVTSHDVFGYFAHRYGFELIGTVIASVSTEASDASAGELARLVDTIKASGVTVIFADTTSNPDLVHQVATSAGVRVAPGLYTDALGQEGTPGATYLEMERYNIDTIVQALLK